MKWNLIWKYVGLTVLHWLICVFAGIFGWDMQTAIVSVTSAALIIYCNRKMKTPLWGALIMVSIFYIMYVIGSYYSDNPLNYPVWMGGIAAVLLTSLLLYIKVQLRITIPVSLVLALLEYFIFYPNWFSYFTQKPPEQFRVFNSKLVDINNKEITAADFKGKVVLLDIWHSACYYCIEDFPELQALYNEYKDDSTVKIFSLNIPLERDSSIRPSKYTDPYTFGKLYFQDQQEYQRFADRAVPLVLILDKQLRTRYAGELQTGWNVYVGNAKKIINELKKEL